MASDDHVSYVLEEWRRELPDLDRSGFAVVGRISRLAQLLQGELDGVFAAHGLTAGEFDVLAALRRKGRPYRMTPTDLSRALIVTSGGMTRRLHMLEADGLTRRAPDPADRRSSAVALTPAGKRLVDKILRDHTRNEDRLISGLTKGDRHQLAALLRELAVSLGDIPPRPVKARRRTGRSSPSRAPHPRP